MKYEDLIDLIEIELTPEYKIVEVDVTGDYVSINQKVAIPVLGRNTCLQNDANIPIHNEEDEYFGMLCFVKNESKELSELTEWELIAYLSDVESIVSKHEFKADYIILDKQKLTEYLENYYLTAPLWGGFYHQDPLPEPFNKMVNKIVAVKNLKFPTPVHYETSIQAINAQFANGRFLEKYHLLELIFDYDLVVKIKGLGDDLEGIGTLLSNYSSSELDRLKKIIIENITDVQLIAKRLQNLFPYDDKARTIFYSFKKQGNPLSEINQFNQFCSAGDFSFATFKSIKNRNATIDVYRKFICELSAFFIYRIRSSIAHKKIGEYIMKQSDEEFVAEFGEPLINEIINQVFKSNTVE